MLEYVGFCGLNRLQHYGIWLVIGAVLGAIYRMKCLKSFIGNNRIILIILPILTISEKWTGYRIPEANDRIGGFGSGFMGGLSGHQELCVRCSLLADYPTKWLMPLLRVFLHYA